MIEWDSNKPDGVTRKVLDQQKLEKILPNFQKVDFFTGLKKTVDWYINNKEEADKRV